MTRLGVSAFLLLSLALAQAPAPIWIVAHRGANNIAPENTIAAFEAAARAGADYMEVDVRTTRDQHLILMHDATVDRTTNGHGAVADLSWEEIRKLDAGEGQRVPSFREALLWAKQRKVRIDVDHKAARIEAIVDAIRETGMTRRVVIEGPVENLRVFAERLPGVETMPKVKSAAEIPLLCRSLGTTIIRLSLDQLADPAFVKAVHQAKARVSVTVLVKMDNEPGIRQVIAQGAQIIETDHPEIVDRLRRR